MKEAGESWRRPDRQKSLNFLSIEKEYGLKFDILGAFGKDENVVRVFIVFSLREYTDISVKEIRMIFSRWKNILRSELEVNACEGLELERFFSIVSLLKRITLLDFEKAK